MNQSFQPTGAEGITPAAITNIREHPGLGLEGLVNGSPVRLGRPDWVGARARLGVGGRAGTVEDGPHADCTRSSCPLDRRQETEP